MFFTLDALFPTKKYLNLGKVRHDLSMCTKRKSKIRKKCVGELP